MSKIEKLELRHLAGYLPYGLEAKMLDSKIDYVGRDIDIITGFDQWDKTGKLWSVLTFGGSKPSIDRIKPLLRPLSDLTKEIEHNGERFVPMDIVCPKNEYKTEFDRQVAIGSLQLQGSIGFSCTYFSIVQKLISWHFDIHGLIESGLAVDINTVKV